MPAPKTLPKLPIDALAERFATEIAGRTAVVVTAATGSGKSTRLPLWLAEAVEGRVLVVEPRRVACRALATYTSGLLGESVGMRVGYQVRFDRKVGADTRVVFATPGIALALVASNQAPPTFGAVMLDEFHERSWEIDLALALARRGGFGPEARLIVCSATLQSEVLAEALGGTVLHSEGRTFPIEVVYQGQGGPNSDDLAPRVRAGVSAALKATDGDVLVFLPGKREISDAVAAVRDLGPEAIPIHGGIDPRTLTKAFAPSKRRRIFVSTNVAETSLTIPSVTAVVDSGLVRQRIHRGGRSILAVVPIALSSMQQRSGRAGRVGPGWCVRLWSEQFEPEPQTPPEVSRVELDDLILRAAMCGVEPRDIEALPWPTALPTFAVEQARDRLRERGAIDDDARLNAHGQAWARLPVSSLGARILSTASPALIPAVAELVAVLEVGRDLLLPASDPSIDEARAKLFASATDEVDVQLLALRSGDPRTHALHPGALREARTLARSLGAVAAHVPDRSALTEHLLARLPDRVFVPRARSASRRDRGTGVPWGNGDQEVFLRPYAIPGRMPDAAPSPPAAGVLLDVEWLGQRASARAVGRLLFRCRAKELVAAGIGQPRVGAPSLDKRRRTVSATVEIVHAGVILGTEERVLGGRELCDALATLLLRGSLRRGFGARYTDAVARWRLLSAWLRTQGDDSVWEPSDAHSCLAMALENVGVGAVSDLALLEDDDLLPPLDQWGAQAARSARELESLWADFPPTFSFEGRHYACDVDFGARRVTLRPRDAATKREPPAKVLPRYRGFSVDFVRASRSIRLR